MKAYENCMFFSEQHVEIAKWKATICCWTIISDKSKVNRKAFLCFRLTSVCVCMELHQYGWTYHHCRGVCWDFRGRCCHQSNIFFQEVSGHLSRIMPDLILHVLQKHGFVGSACASLACLQSRSVAYWKCMVHYEEETQKTVTNNCEAAVLFSQGWANVLLSKL